MGFIMNKEDKYYQYIEDNDFKNLDCLLKNNKNHLNVNHRFDARKAAKNGYLSILKILLSYENLNPSIDDNCMIIFAYNYNQYKIIDFLWGCSDVKKTLQKNHLELYNKLTIKDVEKKVTEF